MANIGRALLSGKVRNNPSRAQWLLAWSSCNTALPNKLSGFLSGMRDECWTSGPATGTWVCSATETQQEWTCVMWVCSFSRADTQSCGSTRNPYFIIQPHSLIGPSCSRLSSSFPWDTSGHPSLLLLFDIIAGSEVNRSSSYKFHICWRHTVIQNSGRNSHLQPIPAHTRQQTCLMMFHHGGDVSYS